RTCQARWWRSHGHHPPGSSRLHREIAVQLQIEREYVHHRFAEDAERSTALVAMHRVQYLRGGDAAGAGHPCHLDGGVSRRDVRVEAAAAGGDRISGHRGVFRRRAPNRDDLTGRVVLTELGALHPNTLIDLLENRG